MNAPIVTAVDDVTVWLADGSIHIRTNDPCGDPVELNGDQARELAAILLRLAEDAD